MIDLYYILQDETTFGPYTSRQLKTMWMNGNFTASATYKIGAGGKWDSIMRLGFLHKEPTYMFVPVVAGFIALIGFVTGAVMFAYGILLESAAKSAMHETTAGAYITVGILLVIVSPLLGIIARK